MITGTLKPMAAVGGIDTRERILRMTLDLIGREGVGAVTNRRVATAAGVSLGSLTYHFESQTDLLRETFMLFVSEEVARVEAIAADLRERRPGIVEVAREIERVIRETGDRMQGLAELELHLRAAREPALQEASLRCFEAYESVAETALEMLEVPDPAARAHAVVALMWGLGLRRLGTGNEDASGTAEALLMVVGVPSAADLPPA